MIQLDKNGIPTGYSGPRPKETMVYKLWREKRATIDHSKFPWSKAVLVSEDEYFMDWKSADKKARKEEKNNPDYLYYVRSCFITINKKQNGRKKISRSI